MAQLPGIGKRTAFTIGVAYFKTAQRTGCFFGSSISYNAGGNQILQ